MSLANLAHDIFQPILAMVAPYHLDPFDDIGPTLELNSQSA